MNMNFFVKKRNELMQPSEYRVDICIAEMDTSEARWKEKEEAARATEKRVFVHLYGAMVVLAYEDVESVVLRAVGSNYKIIDYSLTTLGESNGVLGSHYFLRVDIKDDYNHSKTHKFFLKTRPNCSHLQEFIMDEYNFVEEENFCKELVPRMLEVFHGEKWMPRCYLTNKNVLIFEDLSNQNYAIRSNILLGEQLLKEALSALARFHASSVLLEYKIKKSLKEAYPNSFEEKVYAENNNQGKGTKVTYESMIMMAKRFNLDPTLIPKIYDRVYNLVRGKEGAFNVVCHGDIWKNNIMFDDSSPPKCLLVDFQLLRYASPFVDVAMLLFIHTMPRERKKIEMDMLRHYCSTLQNTVEQSNSAVKIPSFENFLKSYQERRLVGLTYAIYFMSCVFLKPETFAAIMSDSKMLERWFVTDRDEMIRSSMDENPGYEKLMKEIMFELYEEAKRVINV